MTRERDVDLGLELSRLRLPQHRDGFWDGVEHGLASEAETLYCERDAGLGAELSRIDLPAHGEGYWHSLEDVLEFQTRMRRRPPARHWPRRLALAAAAAAAIFLAVAWVGLPSGVGGSERAIAHGLLPALQHSDSAALVDGQTLIWLSRRAPNADTGQPDVNIFSDDLSSGAIAAISPFPSWKQQIAADGGVVVWVDGRGDRPAIFAYDIGSRVERRVAFIGLPRSPWSVPLAADPNVAHLGEPAVSGDTVVWTDARGDIRGADLVTGATFDVAADWWSQQEPAISGDFVVWSDGRGNTLGDAGVPMDGWEIWGRDLKTGRSFPICQKPDDQVAPAISGNIVVWQDGRNRTAEHPDNWDIYGCDLATGREFVVADGPGAQTCPAISGDLVVWTDADTEQPEGASVPYTVIRGYDLHNRRPFTVSDEPGILGSPSISANHVVWSTVDGKGGQLGVYGATIEQHNGQVRALPLEGQEH